MAMVRASKNIVSYVRELKPRKDTSRIEVRIVRLWRNYNKESGNTIEMVFVDKEVREEKVYLSSDSIIPSDVDIDENVVYPAEFLNSVKVAGLPRHCLKLKVGAPIMCLRNMDVADGLCNGTRLIVTQLLPHVIEGRIITGNKIAGHPVWIPRMFVTPPDTKFPFRMRRRRFPVTLAFAMTINKSQGPTLESVGLFLPSPVFSHGQLYVALSRVKSRSGLKILITGKEGKTQTKTLNVVYKQMGSDELGDRLYSGASRFLTTSCHDGMSI
uniref:Uncharacterized protein n=1 Tax=Brassica oleracea TaxID=3712 RepID=A0A3P6DD85_BRAOL|nr:unnamed protein product [Brassica oleracea]